MKLIKILLFLVIVGVLVFFGLNLAVAKGLIKTNPLQSLNLDKIPALTQFKLPSGKLNFNSQETSNQFKILGANLQNAKNFTQAFIQKGVIQKDDSPKPAHEKAFDYGRYLYCQQVVKDYEARNVTPSPTITIEPNINP